MIETELSGWGLRLMRTIERRGLRRFVLLVTAVSVVLSEVPPIPLTLAVGTPAAEMAIGVTLALVVPSIVAPTMAVVIGRLVQALSLASVQLEQLAATDPLTGTTNRRAFAERSASLWARRAGSIATVAMIDVDDFKAVNDRYGHAAGDLVLTTLADNLQRAARAHAHDAVVGRLGGDEFAVDALLDPTVRLDVFDAALQEACRLGSPCPPVTAAAGLVRALESDSVDEALARADHALYASKRPGRRVPSVGVAPDHR